MWIVIGTILIVLGTVGLGLVIDRKLRPRALGAPKREPLHVLHDPGAAPTTAIALSTLRPPRCCTAMTETSREPICYEQREMLVVRFTCPRCGTVRSIYVTEDLT